MTEPGSPATVRFSTADLPENSRVPAWREYYRNTVLRVDIEPGDDGPFEAAFASRVLPGLVLVSGRSTAAQIIRTRAMIADGNDDLSLLVSQTGNLNVSARGREVTLAENDAVLISSADTLGFERRALGESLAIRIPHAVLSPVVVDVDDAVMQRIPRNTAALKLLTGYANALVDDDPAVATPTLRHRVTTHMHDLVALTLGATREAEDIAKNRGVGAARLRAAKLHIMENISRRDISVGGVAFHLGVTPRYLQRLFEVDGSTFSGFLLERRLARAHRMLCEPQSMQRRVSAIAYDVGFGDLSYFNRCFRRRYEATPLEIREAAAN